MSNHFPLFFQTIHDLHIPVTFPQTSVLLAVPFNSFLCTNSSSVLAVLALSKTFLFEMAHWEGDSSIQTDPVAQGWLNLLFFPCTIPKILFATLATAELGMKSIHNSWRSLTWVPTPVHSWAMARVFNSDYFIFIPAELNCHFVACCSRSWKPSGASPSQLQMWLY